MESIQTLNLSRPPTIPASIKNDTKETITEKIIDELNTITITDGIATLEGGILSNLVNPVSDSDAATKSYVITNSSMPGGSDTSVQLAQIWNMQTTPSTGLSTWVDVVDATPLNIFLFTAQNGIFGTGSGVSWTTSTSNTGVNSPFRIEWSADLFVVIIVGEVISRSTNFSTWTTISSPYSFISDVIWATGAGPGTFVAINSGVPVTTSDIITSTNGSTWTTQTTPSFPTLSVWRKIAWSPTLGTGDGRFLAVGGGNTSGTTAININMRSDNGGVTWTSGSSIFPSVAGVGSQLFFPVVTWSSTLSLFCAISHIPTSVNNFSMGHATSSDGITWTTSSTTLGKSVTFKDIVWSVTHSTFVAVSSGGLIATSPNGTTWLISSAPDLRDWNSVAYSPSLDLFAALSDDNVTQNIATSDFSTSTFTGNSNLTFDKTTNTLTSPAFTDGTATLINGDLVNILDPVSAQDAATKNYVDNTTLITQSTISSAFTTYTAAQMVNGVIIRDGITWTTSPVGSIPTDTTATAVNLIAEFADPSVNSVAYFSVYFKTASDTALNALTIVGGTGVTINPINPIIYSNYVAIGRIILDNVTGGSEAVTLHFDSISYFTDINWTDISNPNGWSYLLRSQGLELTETQIKDEFLIPLSAKTLTNQDHIYTFEEISSNKILIRDSLTSDSSDSFVDATTFISNSTPLELGSGGLEFCIQNIDTTYNIVLTTATGWTLNATTAKLTIGPGQNGLFMVQVDTTLNTCNLYALGIYERNGP